MRVFSCKDALIELHKWGIKVPLLPSRSEQIQSFLKEKLGTDLVTELRVTPMAKEDVALVHKENYLNALFDKDSIETIMMDIYELIDEKGNPHRYDPQERQFLFSDLFDLHLKEAQATYLASKNAADKKENTFLLGGGMHHAMTGQGRGFCAINDIVISLKKLQGENLIRHAWVVDVDVHKGDGTAECTESDDSISTLSVHMKRGWPFDESWRPGPWDISSSIDIALDKNEENFYNEKLQSGLKDLEKNFPRPDLVIIVAGSDPYEMDQLKSSSHINLTKEQMLERDLLIYNFFEELKIPQTWLMAGGYGPYCWEIYAQFLEKVLKTN